MWGLVRGLHPRLLELLPCGERRAASSGPRTRGSTGFQRVVNSHHCKPLQKVLKQLLGREPGQQLKTPALQREFCRVFKEEGYNPQSSRNDSRFARKDARGERKLGEH